jgi:SAM-dependent methyltransferase
MSSPRVLDVCCGGRMFWFDKKNPDALFIDNRTVPKQKLANRQNFEIAPDEVMDFRNLGFFPETFSLVVFDPPHLTTAGKKGWQALKYGCLSKDWKSDLARGFRECFRVLKPDGVLIFKWNEHNLPLKEVLSLSPVLPLFGHPSGRNSKTHWIAFIKPRTLH